MKPMKVTLAAMILFLSLSMVVISPIGCQYGMRHVQDTDSDGLSDEREEVLGTDPRKKDTDGDGMDDGEEIERGTDPLNADSYVDTVVDSLQPYGKGIYQAGPTMGAYGIDGVAMFTWSAFSDENGYPPSDRKFACVTPTELPSAFWSKYDTREALMEQDHIDKKANNLYIPFDEDGGISFAINTYRIRGKYSFKICGILDENYIDENSYSGDGDEITVEVAEQGLVVVDKGAILLEKTEYVERYICYWEFEYADGSEFKCGHLDPPQPYEEMTGTDGSKHNTLFEIIEDDGTTKEHTFILYSSKTGNTISRGDRWTLSRGFRRPCGCCNSSWDLPCDKNGLCILVWLREGRTMTVSIAVNENYFIYEGDGDPITVTYSGN